MITLKQTINSLEEHGFVEIRKKSTLQPTQFLLHFSVRINSSLVSFPVSEQDSKDPNCGRQCLKNHQNESSAFVTMVGNYGVLPGCLQLGIFPHLTAKTNFLRKLKQIVTTEATCLLGWAAHI